VLDLVTSERSEAKPEGLAGLSERRADPAPGADIPRSTPRAFTTRRLPRAWMRYSIPSPARPRPGDLVLARVASIGQHRTLHLPSGRRRTLFVGDEVIVAFGDRYAPDQFEARIPERLGTCHLVASGGVASEALSWNEKMRRPTAIHTLAYVGRKRDGRPLNVADNALALAPATIPPPVPVIAVAGTAMNAGKTTVAAQLTRGLRRLGERPAFAKVTGTGSSGDPFLLADAGANPVLDFTDLGFVSTFQLDADTVAAIFRSLVMHASAGGATVVVVEVADGLYQRETAALLASACFRETVGGLLFAASDAMGAAAGAQWLAERNLPILGVTGTLTSAPLQIHEAGEATGHSILRTADLAEAAIAGKLLATVGA